MSDKCILRPVFVGEAPGMFEDPAPALYPFPQRSTGARLANLLGVGKWEYLTRFCLINLLHDPEVLKHPWPTERARYAAVNLSESGLLDHRPVILIGQRVAAAFKCKPNIEVCTWYSSGMPRWKPYAIGVLPHPSGRNRWYNDPENERIAREFLSQVREGRYGDGAPLPIDGEE